ncbi:hypothetical protein [Nocardioides sp.]|uniref:hypothetical protein n=1 Tax=Nocardioides sp. TaxID=35761 RepID=UPI00321A8FDA
MTTLPVAASPDERWYAHKLVQVETSTASRATLPVGPSQMSAELPIVPHGELWLLETVHLYLILGQPVTPATAVDLEAVLVTVTDADLPAAAENEAALFGQIADTSLGQQLSAGGRQWTCTINRPQPIKVQEGYRAGILASVRTETGAGLSEMFIRAQFMRLRSPDVV